MNPNAKKLLLGCAGCASLFMLLVCLAIAGLAAYTTWTTIAAPPTPVAQTTSLTPSPSPAAPTAVPPITPAPQHPITPSPHHLITPSPTLTAQPLPTATPSAYPLLSAAKNVTQDPIPPRAAADLAALLTADYPPNDYFEVANRLGRAGLTARTVTAPRYQVGDTRSFFTDEGSIDATLLAVTEHAYFWVETGLNLDATAVAAAADRLETRYYPRLTALFGEAWQPGVDNDPRFAILHLRLPVDAAELGFFASLDQYPQSLYSDSNQQEMVYLNMAELDLNEDLYDGTLVHELQHLSQWFLDPNETAWLNEGLSQLAELVVGLHTAETTAYLEQPDIRLNTWEYDEETIDAHYAGAYLFSVYLWEQLGETAVHELVRHPANGMAAVDAALRGYDSRTLPAFFGDWAAANYLDDPAAGAAYNYAALALAPPVVERRVRQLPFRHTAALPQFGVHYLDLPAAGAVTLSFAGDTVAPLFPPPPGAATAWFAPTADESNAQLTLPLDLTGLQQATLTFDAWYDLEEDWDFAYLQVSTDGGATWELLRPAHDTRGEYGPAWNGRSAAEPDARGGWVPESVSLDAYAGGPVLLRIDVLTDSAITGQGVALANLQVPEMPPTAGWPGLVARGFVETGPLLPQAWQLRLIHPGATPRVETLPLDDWNQGTWTVELGPNGGVLVITTATPFVADTGDYWLDIR